jgi:hypothetical protein
MDAKELDLIRAIGRQRGINRFYRTCYLLLKALQELIAHTSDDLLLFYQSDPPSPSHPYSSVQGIATDLQQAIKGMREVEAEALTAWKELQNPNSTMTQF